MCQYKPLSSTFYLYGLTNGDSKLPKEDDSSFLQSFSRSFQFFGRSLNSLYLCTNGFFDLSSSNSLEARTSPLTFPTSSHSCISPLWLDIDIRKNGEIYYRETTNSVHLSKITQDIRKSYVLNSDINWAFIATWENVCLYGSSCTSASTDQFSTFQATIASNGVQTYVIFKYSAIDRMTNKTIQSGYNDAQTLKFFSTYGTDIRQTLLTTSNVNRPGLWIFRVDI